MMSRKHICSLIALMGGLVTSQIVRAQDHTTEKTETSRSTTVKTESQKPISLDHDERTETETTKTRTTTTTTTTTTHFHDDDYGYHGADDFFNVQEANPNVQQGEWEFESFGGWSTISNQKDDEIGLAQSIKYGITDDFFFELKVLERNLGDGRNQGNGNINLILFNRFVRESDSMPAIAAQMDLRVPSGDGSSGVDGKLTGIITKTIVDKLRVNFQGWAQTANGDEGGGQDRHNRHFHDDAFEDRQPGRRNFQWGMGPGVDYQIDDDTLVLVNYINKTSNLENSHNLNIIETGLVRRIYQSDDVKHWLKLAFDIGLDHGDETPNWAAKLQWSIAWK